MQGGRIVRFLKALYRGWMKFAHVLGWVNTRIILSLVYIIIMTPMALIFKVVGKDPMKRKLGAEDSYWIKRESKTFDRDSYRRQF